MESNMKSLVESTILDLKAAQGTADTEQLRIAERQAHMLAEAKEYAAEIITGLKILKEKEGSKFDFEVKEHPTGVCLLTNIDYPVGPHGGRSVVSIHVGGDDRWNPKTVRVYGRGEMHVDGAEVPDAAAQVVRNITRMAVNWKLIS